jgi:hypothetical protein
MADVGVIDLDTGADGAVLRHPVGNPKRKV